MLEIQLLLDGEHAVGEEAVESKCRALIERKRQVLGEQPAIEQFAARDANIRRQAGGQEMKGEGSGRTV